MNNSLRDHEDLCDELRAELLLSGFRGAARMIMRVAQEGSRGEIYALVGVAMHHEITEYTTSSFYVTRSLLSDAILYEASSWNPRNAHPFEGYWLDVPESNLLDPNTPPSEMSNARKLLNELRAVANEERARMSSGVR